MKSFKLYLLIAVFGLSTLFVPNAFATAGAPVRGIDVVVQKNPPGTSARQIATPDADGNLTVDLPGPGTFTISYADGPMKGEAIKTLTVTQAGPVIVETTIRKGHSNVVNNREAVPAVQATTAALTETNWSGFYFGGHVGGTSNNYDIKSYDEHVDVIAQFYQELGMGVSGEVESGFSDFTLPRDNGSSNTRPTGGFQAGYNMQFGHIVVGLESNVGFTGADETARGSGFVEKFFTVQFTNDTEADTTLTTKRHAEMNWNASTELHLGYTWNQFLFYVLGGGAFAGVTVTTQDVASTDFFQFNNDGGGIAPQQGRFLGNVTNGLNNENSQVLTGYTAGGGVAMALTSLVSVNLEYRHTGYGEGNFNFQGNEFIVPGSNNVAVDTDQVLFKVNLLLGH